MITAERFKKQVLEIADEIGIEPREVHVRKMTRKWGSCSTTGRLTFATALLEQCPAKRREVIVHELLHLRYPNHGRMFRLMLERHTKEVAGSLIE
ncbi:MAG TPA: M48 family metallopeptidase [Acidobacteriota bacterium]|nr:M48 family metallopeptidase [Acidobacteriota bacterium]